MLKYRYVNTNTMTSGISANKIGTGPRRRPRRYTEGRVCSHSDCRTIISRYNAAEFCFRHAPPTFRRLRGVVSDGG